MTGPALIHLPTLLFLSLTSSASSWESDSPTPASPRPDWTDRLVFEKRRRITVFSTFLFPSFQPINPSPWAIFSLNTDWTSSFTPRTRQNRHGECALTSTHTNLYKGDVLQVAPRMGFFSGWIVPAFVKVSTRWWQNHLKILIRLFLGRRRNISLQLSVSHLLSTWQRVSLLSPWPSDTLWSEQTRLEHSDIRECFSSLSVMIILGPVKSPRCSMLCNMLPGT